MGDGCDRYLRSTCGGRYDDKDFNSGSMCCVCGGGDIGNYIKVIINMNLLFRLRISEAHI